jgi:phage terminase Nu1 subunit (DNA packaging protein)
MARTETVTTAVLAAAFSVTTRTVQLWRQAGMPSRTLDGAPRFVLRECIAWRLETVRAEERQRERARHSSDDMERRKLAAEAELKELQLAERRGEVVPLTEYQSRLDTFVGGFAATAAGQLHRFERDIVTATTPGDARKITQRIHSALMTGANEYADQLETEIAATEAAA